MKNLVLTLCITSCITASPECMDKASSAAKKSGSALYSYSQLSCSCHCERYSRLFEQGRCSNCRHVCIPKALPLKSEYKRNY
ncbi:hypothetical protein H0X48_02605 [Candidatus Dependentiae bacterium]|nr:hypothetical protein [Candidatus Dependentiae bacterium]